MNIHADTRTLRQAHYIRRAGRARRFAWLLMPVTMACLSAAMWSDPVVRPKLMTGLEVIKPMITAAMDGEFSTERVRDIQAAALEQAAELNATLFGLPTSKTTINRPETDG